MAYLNQAVAFTRDSVDADNAPTDGDSNPTAVLYRNGEATAETVTVTTTADTGKFKYTFTIPSGWSVGDVVSVRGTHAIDSTSYANLIWEAVVEHVPLTTLGTNAPANWINAAAITDGSYTTAKFADGVFTAAKFASGAFDAIWSSTITNSSTLPSSSDHSTWTLLQTIRMISNRFFGNVQHDRPNATITTYDYDETTAITEQSATTADNIETQGKSETPT